MGSMGSPSNSNWPPYNSYRDCSQGICSIYCPQWCYLIFPPPPAFQSGDDDSGMNFSPLIIVVIGILASAFLLISYYTLISKYCKRSRNRVNAPVEFENHNHSTTHDQLQRATTGLDESLIKSIAVCKYKKSDGVVEGSECAVCLSEFQEGESLRLLPKCNHAFHLQCIDTWLRSHSNCPLCRSHVMPGIPVPFQRPLESQITSSNFHVSSLVFQRRNDLVLVAEETQQDDHRNEVVVNVIINEILPKYPSHELECNAEEIRIPMNMEIGNDQEVQEYRRSTSLGAMPSQDQNLLIADILNTEEDYENHDNHNQNQVGTSKGQNSRLAKRSNNMKRSLSTGRFVFTRHDKGKNSILPN
ncbi:RING/U-box superfamily protein [Artemisia annua]|uniref:RING-type E3 ubiquitin transferase n=1 Tax=Artemisia annua TaxID=35608 RepID=A0A2U1LC40_ARTAN|nr:RING/U-box superfamily protein [Artemisia annua]